LSPRSRPAWPGQGKTMELQFVRAHVGDREDNVEYFSILPTSPP
jgi:hypothetical protein